MAPPRRVVVADDTTSADAAYRLACEGTGLLWRGDYQNARQMLQAMARRIDRRGAGRGQAPASLTEAFHRKRMAQAQRARVLGMLLIPFDVGHVIPLRRAPDVREACAAVRGEADRPYVASLRELLAMLKQNFAQVAHFKPPSSRQESVEMYVVAKGFKGRSSAVGAGDAAP